MAGLRGGIRLFGFYFAEESKTSVRFFSFWDIGWAGWATRACSEWVRVECLFISGCHENKAVVIESVIWDPPWVAAKYALTLFRRQWLIPWANAAWFSCRIIIVCQFSSALRSAAECVAHRTTSCHMGSPKCCAITRGGLKEICYMPHLYSYSPPQKNCSDDGKTPLKWGIVNPAW